MIYGCAVAIVNLLKLSNENITWTNAMKNNDKYIINFLLVMLFLFLYGMNDNTIHCRKISGSQINYLSLPSAWANSRSARH